MSISPLLSADDVRMRLEALADRIAPVVDDHTIGICLLTGGLWFAADLMRALAVRGRHLVFDALWLSSYGDSEESGGQVRVHGGLQRSVADRQVLLMDDVFDSGLSLDHATRLVRSGGAREVLSAVFARKPSTTDRPAAPDFVAWEAPARFLVGYGMDAGGRFRGYPGIGTLD